VHVSTCVCLFVCVFITETYRNELGIIKTPIDI
jgi:hypothetical protein